ncbi:MAG: hypothetical protein JWN74_1535 [Acidobacteriaceae bacterium]|nr:hypothetical protein [Acidobacteriaceae bacterium]
MKGQKKEIWMQLCERAASEQDPDKLMELVKEINQLLEEKERRLKNTSADPNRGAKNELEGPGGIEPPT